VEEKMETNENLAIEAEQQHEEPGLPVATDVTAGPDMENQPQP
jgi:hypothetical protein